MVPGGQWIECGAEWVQPIYLALQDGTTTLRLPRVYRNKHGEEVTSWYAVDLTDINAISQQNESSGTRNERRLMRKVASKVPPPGAPPVLALGDGDGGAAGRGFQPAGLDSLDL